MLEVTKGKQTNVSVTFKRRGQVCTFLNPPTWIVYNEAGKKILSGTATNDGSKWVASFAVSTSYIVHEGKEDLTIEFSGYDQSNNGHVKSVDVTLIDTDEDYKPIGIIYSLINNVPLRDVIQVDYEELSSVDWSIMSPVSDDPVLSGTVNGPIAYDSATSKGYNFKLDLGRPILNTVYNDPYLLVINANVESEDDPLTEIHPVYLLNAKTSTLANQLSTYLDKARLTEIDPTLQWNLPEYLHFTLEGIKHINSAPSEPTWWTVKDLPTILRQCLFSASALYALNARYLAEGFNAFEFAGLNTNLNFNRLEPIIYKIEELKSYLEANLVLVKKAAVSANGPGTPTEGESDTRMIRVGSLGLQSSPMSNRISRHKYRRFR